MLKMKKILINVNLLLLLYLMLGSGVYAGELILSWDPNNEFDLAGYKVHYGTSSRNYSNSIDIGNYTTYTLRNLTDGTRYFIAVTAYDDSRNESDYSEEVNAIVKIIDITAPNPPTITNTQLIDNKITLTWTKSVDADVAGYKVYYGTSSHNYINTILVGNSTSYTTPTLAEGVTYFFAVTAYDTSNNESAHSSEVNVLVPAKDTTPPAVPIIISYDTNDMKVSLAWGNVTDPDLAGYKVYYGTRSRVYDKTIDVGTALTYTTPDLSEGVTYYFAVTSYDISNNESAHSSEVNVLVPVKDTTPPAVPTIISYDTNDMKVSLAWGNVTDADLAGYKVYYGTRSRVYDKTIDVGTALTYTTPNLVYGVTYYFAVASYDKSNNQSQNSAEVAVICHPPDNTPPAPPVITYYVREDNKVYIMWRANTEPDIKGYKIHYGERSRTYNNVIDLQLKREYLTPELSVGKTYFFAVTAYDTSDNLSPYSNEVSVLIPVPDNEAPAAPVILSHTRTDNSVSITWRANAEKDLKGYYLYSGKASANYDNKVDVGKTTSYTLANLQYGLTYFFAVTAVDTIDNESVYSQEISVMIQPPDVTPPAIPVITTYYRTDKQVYLAWNKVADTDLAGYRVSYGFMSRTYDKVIDVTKTNYTTPELEEGVTYFFAVSSYDSLKNISNYSAEVSVSIPTPDIIPPALPTIMSYSRQGNRVALQWNENQEKDFQSYKLYIGKSSRNYNSSFDLGQNTNYLTSELEYGSTYFFALTAIDTAYNESNYSAEVSVYIPPLDLTAPAVPSFTKAVRLNNKASFEWRRNTEADFKKYNLHIGRASRNYVESRDMGQNTTYITEELEFGVPYYFALTSVDTANNESGYSAEAVITVPIPDTTPPSNPIITEYSRLDNKVLLSWSSTNEADLSGYRLSMGTASKTYSELVDVGLATTYTTRPLDYGKTYYFVIAAYDTAKNYSGPSNEVAVIVPMPDNMAPQIPTIAVYERRKYTVYLQWNAVPDNDLTNYTVHYGKSSGNYDVHINNAKELSYLTPDLDHGVTFYFSVTATDTVGNVSGYSREVKISIPVPDLTAPVPPLISEYSLQEAKVYLRWQANNEPDVAGYNLYYGTSSGNYTKKQEVGNKLDYLTPDLVVGSKYFFVVTAYDTAKNESAYSNEVNITISIADKIAPTAPVITSHRLEETKARIEWGISPEADVAGYRLYYGNNSKNYQQSIDVGLATAYLTRDLEQGKYYYFAVTAYDTVANESKHSSEVSLYVPVIDKTAPQAPVITQSTLDNRIVSLTWLSSPDMDLSGYKVHYGNSAGMYDETIDVGSRTSYSSNALTEGLTYYFAVSAYDTAANESGYSNEVVIYIPIPDTEAPSIPVLSDYSIENNQVIINWYANKEVDVAGYKVYIGTVSRNYTSSMNVNKSTKYTSKQLEFDTAYFFAVTAYDGANNESGYSAEVEVFIQKPDLTAPAAPIISSYNLDQDKIHVSWMANSESDLGGYKFHYGTAPGIYLEQIDVAYNLEYTTPELQRGIKYYFTVTAYDTVGNESAYARELNIKIPEQSIDTFPPSRPRFSTYYVDGNSVHLEWHSNNEEDLGGYRVYQGTASENYDHITDVGKQTFHRQNDLEQGVTYFFAISAYDTVGNESSLSAEVSLSIPVNHIDTMAPSIPTIASYNVEGNRIRVRWNANTEPDLSGYRFYYGTASRMYVDSVDVGNALNYTTRELERGVKYYFAITAYDTLNNESDYSTEIGLKIPDQVIDTTAPHAPIFVSHEILGNSIKLTWEANSDSDLAGYRVYYGTQSTQYDMIVDVGNVLSYTTRELQRGLTYYFALRAYDGSTNESNFSAELPVFIPRNEADLTAPDIPEIVSVTVDERKVHIVWKPVTNMDLEGYRVYYGTKVDNYDVVVDAGNGNEYVTDDLSEGIIYYFVITSYDTAGNESGFSKQAAAEIPVMDIIPPTIYALDIQDSLTVNLLYSEAVEKTSAEQASNYSINNGIQISQATLDDNQRLVTLTTTAHRPNVEYTLTVNNIKDIAKNPNIIKANSSVTYNYDPEDHKPPFMINVMALDATHIEITFNEDVERKTAENLANFSINNGISVVGSQLAENLRDVTLTTSAHTHNVHYVVTVNNVTDRAAKPNTIASNSQFGYTYLEKDTESPRLYSAEIIAKDQVMVMFTELVNESSAETIGNYVIDHDMVIISADLQPNLRQVKLMTSQHQIAVNYRLIVNNVMDRAIPANVIDAEYNQYRYRYSPQDNQPPVIDIVQIKDATHIDLTYNEEIERQSAEKLVNYSINKGIGIISAELDKNYRVVHLTTTAHQNGESYQITVNNVSDRAPVPNVIAANSVKKYIYSVSDNASPEIIDVIVNNATSIDVVFNEIVDRVSAENKLNYAITNGIQLYKAFLKEDLKTVNLSTSEHKAGETYELSVANIKDRALPANIITEAKRFRYQYNVSVSSQGVIVSNFNITRYQIGNLKVKDKYYIDRSYVINRIPAGYEGLLWIKTANDDRYETKNVFFSFDLTKAATVYIAYDSKASAVPSWLKDNYTSTGKFLEVSGYAEKLEIWERHFDKGRISMGGNSAAGAQGAESMYIILIKVDKNEIANDKGDDDSNDTKSGADDVKLFQNYPNPFNAGTEIRFQIPEDSYVTVTVYNILGQTVKHLAEGERQASQYVLHWDGRNAEGNLLPSGVYFLRLEVIRRSTVNGRQVNKVLFNNVRKMLFLK